MPSNHLILCRPLLLLPSIFPSIKVFSNESALRIRWPKYWSFSFSISLPMNIQDWFPLGWTGWISLQSKGLSRVFSTTVQKHQFFGAQLSLWSNSHIHTGFSIRWKWKLLSHVPLCDSMDCSTLGFPVLHYLPEFAQIHVHWISDAIQPSRPLSSPSPPTHNLSQHQGLFQWVNSSHQLAKVLQIQFQHQSFQWIFRTDFL